MTFDNDLRHMIARFTVNAGYKPGAREISQMAKMLQIMEAKKEGEAND